MAILRTILLMFLCLPAFGAPEWIAVNKAGTGFVTESGAKFTPWGYNYFRDEKYRLLEDYWNSDKPDGWPKFERDFREMKRLGANVVRIHLQFAKFMDAPGKPNQENVARLSKVIDLAEKIGVYLDITGLGTYRLKDVPDWYNKANEKDRWAMQAEFWEAIAKVCANRSAVLNYNLMNEPLATTSKQSQWTNANEINGQTYVEFINVEPAGRKAPEIAKAWIRQMTAAIRKHDQRHLITVGLIWITTINPEMWAGFPSPGNRARSRLPRSPRLSGQGKGQRRNRFTQAVSGGQADCGRRDVPDELLAHGVARLPRTFARHRTRLARPILEPVAAGSRRLEGRRPRTAARTVRGHAASQSESLSPVPPGVHPNVLWNTLTLE
jgi:Cellulase (glycosyl hydrolase family 5)